MHALLQDLRYGARQLGRNPGFALTAILTLALGVGATTAVFSVAYGVPIDPFPYLTYFIKDVKTLATPKLCASERRSCGWIVIPFKPEDGLNGHTGSRISLHPTLATNNAARVGAPWHPGRNRLRPDFILWILRYAQNDSSYFE